MVDNKRESFREWVDAFSRLSRKEAEAEIQAWMKAALDILDEEEYPDLSKDEIINCDSVEEFLNS